MLYKEVRGASCPAIDIVIIHLQHIPDTCLGGGGVVTGFGVGGLD